MSNAEHNKRIFIFDMILQNQFTNCKLHILNVTLFRYKIKITSDGSFTLILTKKIDNRVFCMSLLPKTKEKNYNTPYFLICKIITCKLSSTEKLT